MYPPEHRSTNVDFDWFYRRAFPNVSIKNGFTVIWQVNRTLQEELQLKLAMCLYRRKNTKLSGLLSRNYPSENMAMWVAVVLASYLLAFFNKTQCKIADI